MEVGEIRNSFKWTFNNLIVLNKVWKSFNESETVFKKF